VLNHSRGDKMATDTSGQQAVDFVWGPFPMQPNNDRAAAITPANIGGGAGDYSWSATTRVASDRLDPALSNHAVAEAAYAGYPGFTGNDDGAYVSGVAYIVVPSVLGDTTAVALDELKDAGYEASNITTAAAATNAVSTITAVARTLTAATITSSGAGAKYPVGTKITVASLVSPDTALNGTWTVTAVATNTVSFTTTTSGTLSTTGLSVAGLTGVAGTIKTQSTAAGAASVATTATITITPWATAS
jgi:hypothetical protein